jgi:hypothetical protein
MSCDSPQVAGLIVGIGRATTELFQLGPVALQAELPYDVASNSGVAISWSVTPVIPPQFFRRISLQTSIGAGYVLTYPKGITIAQSNSLLLWGINGGATQPPYATWQIDE